MVGNLMFQIAHGYSKSLEYNRQFILPIYDTTIREDIQNILFKNFDFIIPNSNYEKEAKIIQSTNKYKKIIPYDDCPTIFSGYYQTEKYFKNHKEIIKNIFAPNQEFINKVKTDFDFLNNGVTLGIHVRRENFYINQQTSPSLTIEYYNEALARAPRHENILIVSDDIEWCKENFKFNNVFFSEGYNDYEDIWLLSLCNHFIISNSSFSWWGAYLSRNVDKVVITPSKWFGPAIKDYPYDIWCDGYIRIPTIYRKNDNKMILKTNISLI
jgi:hypothetical protein